jgi:acyl-CoA synthetase (AMP-forming)/AMP-acid ligase II
VTHDATIGNRPGGFAAVLHARAQEHPDSEAFVFLDDAGDAEGVTFGELDRRARAVAAAIQQTLPPRARVLLVSPPGLDYVAAVFGCFYAGAIAVPAYPPDPRRLARTLPRLQALARDARPQGVLTAGTDELSALLGDAPVLRTDRARADGDWRPPRVDLSDAALLQYTSGATASPRGVVLSHANLLDNSERIRRAFGHSEDGRGVSWLPPYHDMGLIGGVLQPVYAGIPCTLMSPLTFLRRPLRWLRAISEARATTSGGPNFAYELCVRRDDPELRRELDLSSWEVAFNGSERVRGETIDAFSEAFADCGFRPDAFCPCYGLAEATLMVTSVDPEQSVRATAVDGSSVVSCGRPVSRHRVVVVDRTTREEVGEGCAGEIWVAGPSVGGGYWECPGASKRVFDARLADSLHGPSFLKTGDLGFMLDGELFVTGRIKELIIVDGRNHYPADIEWECESAVPGLRRGCGAAFSVERGGRERLTIVYEVATTRQPVVDDIIAHIRRTVASTLGLEVASVVLVRPRSVPKTSSGKVQRAMCRSLLLARELDTVGEWSLPGEGAQGAPQSGPHPTVPA